MNETIKELINSPNYEDVELGAELLYRSGNREFFIHARDNGFFIPYKWHLYITRVSDKEANNPHYIIWEYCRKNNYWIYK